MHYIPVSGSLLDGAAGGPCGGRAPALLPRYASACIIGGTALRIWHGIIFG